MTKSALSDSLAASLLGKVGSGRSNTCIGHLLGRLPQWALCWAIQCSVTGWCNLQPPDHCTIYIRLEYFQTILHQPYINCTGFLFVCAVTYKALSDLRHNIWKTTASRVNLFIGWDHEPKLVVSINLNWSTLRRAPLPFPSTIKDLVRTRDSVFSVAASLLWNSLSREVRLVPPPEDFWAGNKSIVHFNWLKAAFNLAVKIYTQLFLVLMFWFKSVNCVLYPPL